MIYEDWSGYRTGRRAVIVRTVPNAWGYDLIPHRIVEPEDA